MATPNYSYEKRQRELAKKRKTEEKRNRKNNPSRPDGAPGMEGSDPAANGAGPSDQAASGDTA